MKKVLFVCHGNICRSPMAEFVMKDLVEKAGILKPHGRMCWRAAPPCWKSCDKRKHFQKDRLKEKTAPRRVFLSLSGALFYCGVSFVRRRRQASSFTSSMTTAVRGIKKMMPMMPKSSPPIMAATRV